jgi:hypothetical protein
MIKDFAMFRYTGSGEILELDLGFIPDYVHLFVEGAAGACVESIWSRMLEDNGAAATKGGISYGNTGASTLYTHGNGIEAFEGAKKTPTIKTWAVGMTLVAKTATTRGTFVRPSFTAGHDKSAVFECLVAGTATIAATEPNWDTAPALSDSLADNEASANTWQRVNVAEEVKQCAGIEIAAALAVNDTIYWGYAIRGSIVKDFGDVAKYPVGVTASSRIASLA